MLAELPIQVDKALQFVGVCFLIKSNMAKALPSWFYLPNACSYPCFKEYHPSKALSKIDFDG